MKAHFCPAASSIRIEVLNVSLDTVPPGVPVIEGVPEWQMPDLDGLTLTIYLYQKPAHWGAITPKECRRRKRHD